MLAPVQTMAGAESRKESVVNPDRRGMLGRVAGRSAACAAVVALILSAAPGAWANSRAPALGQVITFDWSVQALCIAVLEAVALCVFWKRSLWYGFLVLLAANVLSVGVGGMILDGERAWAGVTLHNLLSHTVWVWCAAFLLSVAVEYPFFLAVFASAKPRRLVRSLQACVVLHLAFYVLAAPVYFYYGYYLSAGRYAVARDASFLKGANAWVYYVAQSRDAVWRCRADGSANERLVPLDPGIDPQYETIWLRKGDGGEGWDLCVVTQQPGNRLVSADVVDQTLWEPPDREPWLRRMGSTEKADDEEKVGGIATGSLRSYEPVLCADLRAPGDRRLEFRIALKWYLGVSRNDNGKYEWGEMAIESPSWVWRIQNCSVLPGDRVVFALGDQICVLDYPGKRLAIIARGYRPIVVRDHAEPWQAKE